MFLSALVNDDEKVSDARLPITYFLLKKLYMLKIQNLKSDDRVDESKCEKNEDPVDEKQETVVEKINRLRSDYVYEKNCYEIIRYNFMSDSIQSYLYFFQLCLL